MDLLYFLLGFIFFRKKNTAYYEKGGDEMKKLNLIKYSVKNHKIAIAVIAITVGGYAYAKTLREVPA